VINPIASICSVAMMIDTLGQEEMGKAIETAVIQTTSKLKSLSAGKMGYSTSEVGDLVAEAIRNV
ncbi:MAG: isocitrate/isopropylmalate family dehydrogenase, partial [Desulfobacterales bacterium]